MVKLGAIGDVVMALPILETAFQNDPNVEITWICGRTVEPVLRRLEKINELIVVDDEKLLCGNLIQRLRVLLGLWIQLLFRRYDLVVTGYSDWRYRFLSATVIAKTRRSFGRNRKRPLPVSGRYFPAEYVRLLTMVEPVSSPEIKIPELNWPLPENLEQKMELQSYKKRIALAPGGAKNLLRDDALRRWPLENYVLLAGMLIEEGFQVLLTGSNTDSWVRESFKSLAVTDLVGLTTIADLITVYRQCHLVVTHDSGPLHLAIASGSPTLALFGPTIPMEKVPNNKKTRVLWGGENLACRPCYDGRNYADCKNNQCMKDLSVEKVHFEVVQIMKSPQAGPS